MGIPLVCNEQAWSHSGFWATRYEHDDISLVTHVRLTRPSGAAGDHTRPYLSKGRWEVIPPF